MRWKTPLSKNMSVLKSDTGTYKRNLPSASVQTVSYAKWCKSWSRSAVRSHRSAPCGRSALPPRGLRVFCVWTLATRSLLSIEQLLWATAAPRRYTSLLTAVNIDSPDALVLFKPEHLFPAVSLYCKTTEVKVHIKVFAKTAERMWGAIDSLFQFAPSSLICVAISE